MASIQLSKILGNNIFTRRTISNFFEELNKRNDKEIEIDFSKVEFISRSCADEYIKKKKESNKKIVEVNMSENVCSMFNVVKDQYERAGFSVSFNFRKSCNKEFVSA